MTNYGRIAHDAYEKAAEQYGCGTNPLTRVAWEDLPVQNQLATLAAAHAVVNEVESRIVEWLHSMGAWTLAAEIEHGYHNPEVNFPDPYIPAKG